MGADGMNDSKLVPISPITHASNASIPILLIHGDDDKVIPIDASARRLAREIPGSVLKEYDGAPHALVITHKDDFNRDLVSFLQGSI